jgi:hypothetical protein
MGTGTRTTTQTMKMSNMVIDQPEPRSCVPCLNGSFQDRIIKSH